MGRETQVGELASLLGSARLVTLTGPPGIGKTRLALRVAGELAGSDRFPDGANLAELAGFGDPDQVPGAVASALGVQEVSGASLTDALVGHLRQRRLLLVLDNCEHVVAACAGLVEAILRACPGLVVLATSRESLAVTGERVWRVPQLAVPPADETDPEALLRWESVALFAERASATQPEFTVDEENAPAVASLSRALEGIPLAIELAAARVAVLTPAEIVGRLDDRFAVLIRGGRNGLARHQTLQAALDWSHDLLDAEEQALLRRVSVFVDGFCLSAAEAVCSDGDAVAPEDVLGVVERLVSKSLVVSNTANSRGRYRLLETVRAYATDRLEESGESGALHEAHATFYLALAEEAEPELTGPRQLAWLNRLEGERQNLRFAVLWCVGHADAERALRLAGALVLYWRVRCHLTEGRELLEATVRVGDLAPPAMRAKALWGVGFLRVMTGDHDGAEAPLKQSDEIWSDLGDRSGSARAQLLLANAVRHPPAVLPAYARSAELARESGDRWCLAHALCLAGQAHAGNNEHQAAGPLLAEGLAVARAAGDPQSLRMGLYGRGMVALGLGDYPAAETAFGEAAVVAHELGDEHVGAAAVHYLGLVALGRGDLDRARELIEQAAALRPKVGVRDHELGTLLALGRLAHIEGGRDRARELFEEVEAIGIAREGRSRLGLLYMADLLADEEEIEEARVMYDATLDWAHKRGSESPELAALALDGLGRLARAAGDVRRAVALHGEALELQRGVGATPGIVSSIEALAGLACAAGRARHGARLLAAAQAQRDRAGYARKPWESRRYECDVEAANSVLGAEEHAAAAAEGRRMSLEEAIVEASKGRRRRGRPTNGWASLTPRERQIALLVADDLTNPQIAERMFVTPETVKAHLKHVFPKLGVSDRRELAREVRRLRQLPNGLDPDGSPNGD